MIEPVVDAEHARRTANETSGSEYSDLVRGVTTHELHTTETLEAIMRDRGLRVHKFPYGS